MEFPSTQVPEALRQRVVARIPMAYRYGGQGTPEAGYSTLGAIARGVRTSTLRRANSIPARVRPGQVVEFFDNDRNRSVLAVVTGRGRVDLTEPGLHERLSGVEGWTPAFLRSYLKPAQSWEQITYQPLVTRAEGRVSPNHPFTPELIDSVIRGAYGREMAPDEAASRSVGAGGSVLGDGARAAEEAPAPRPSASKLPELQLDRENFSALSRSGKLDGIGLRPEIVPGLAGVGEQRLVVYNGNRALEVHASRDPKTGLYAFQSLGRRKREIPVEYFSEPPPEVIESTRSDTSSAPPSAATGDGVPEVVQEAIIGRHPELKEEAQRVFPAKTSNKRKSAQTDQPASSVPPPGEESLDFNAARKLTRSQKVVATLAGAEHEINRLRAEIGDLHQARESAPTQEVYNKLTAQLDELRGQHAELESRYTAAQEAMETMVSKEEYDKAVARHVAEAVIPDEQKMKANWRLAKRYGLPALAGVLGVAAGGALFGDGDEVVVVDSGSGRQN